MVEPLGKEKGNELHFWDVGKNICIEIVHIVEQNGGYPQDSRSHYSGWYRREYAYDLCILIK